MRTAPSALSWPVAVEAGHAGDGWIEAALLLDPGSPVLRAANLSLRFPPRGVPEALAVHDPVARPGDGLDTLAGVAASLLDGHLASLVERLAELRPGRGRRALWALVANACSAAILEAGEGAGARADRARARDLVDGLFSLPGSPLPGPPRVLALPSLGGRLVRSA
jgi:hypothetical protein